MLLYANFNYDFDIQKILMQLKPKLSRSSRVLAVCYNPYLRWLFSLAQALGLRQAELPTTFVTRSVLLGIAKLSGFEVVRERPAAHFPFALFGTGTLFDRLLSALPLLRNFAVVEIVFLRPILPGPTRPSLSIVIPARNERANIAPALERMPCARRGSARRMPCGSASSERAASCWRSSTPTSRCRRSSCRASTTPTAAVTPT